MVLIEYEKRFKTQLGIPQNHKKDLVTKEFNIISHGENIYINYLIQVLQRWDAFKKTLVNKMHKHTFSKIFLNEIGCTHHIRNPTADHLL